MTVTNPISAPEMDKPIDRGQLSTTLSVYVSNERMQSVFDNWTADIRKLIRTEYLETQKLRDAIDPLFNDVAMRDRNSTLDEFLIDVPGRKEGEPIQFLIPDTIRWTTEGRKFRADLGPQRPRDATCQMFWYVHSNGSLSFHMTFRLEYAHTYEDFYFLSILQKMFFPKEFTVEGRGAEPEDICSDTTGIWPLDNTRVRRRSTGADAAGGPGGTRPHIDLSFWQYVRGQFDTKLDDLIQKLLKWMDELAEAQKAITDGKLDNSATPRSLTPKDVTRVARILKDIGERRFRYRHAVDKNRTSATFLWDHLVAVDRDDFIEVPRLQAPAVRSVMMFKDGKFLSLLQPNERATIINNKNYANRLPPDHDRSAEIVITKAAFDAPQKYPGPFDIRHYFLSGFFQNIIDFLNQDASEVLDGIDPIYPVSDAQAEEKFFVCYANGRSLFEVVENSRSLDAGLDYIGICPYLFLVHLMALHNEFVIRRYEKETKEIQDQLESSSLTNFGNMQSLISSIQAEAFRGKPVGVEEINKATSRFYEFRYRAFTIFIRHLYDNTFRYDTERDVFDELLKIRGTTTRQERCKSIVDGLDKTMQDLEEDKRHREQSKIQQSDNRLQYLVVIVGFFSVMQAAFQAVEVYRNLFIKNSEGATSPTCRITDFATFFWCDKLSSADTIGLILLVVTILLGGAATMYSAYFFSRLTAEWWRRRRQR